MVLSRLWTKIRTYSGRGGSKAWQNSIYHSQQTPTFQCPGNDAVPVDLERHQKRIQVDINIKDRKIHRRNQYERQNKNHAAHPDMLFWFASVCFFVFDTQLHPPLLPFVISVIILSEKNVFHNTVYLLKTMLY